MILPVIAEVFWARRGGIGVDASFYFHWQLLDLDEKKLKEYGYNRGVARVYRRRKYRLWRKWHMIVWLRLDRKEDQVHLIHNPLKAIAEWFRGRFFRAYLA